MAGASNEEEIAEEIVVPRSGALVLEQETETSASSDYSATHTQLTGVVAEEKGPVARKAPAAKKGVRKSHSGPAKRNTKESFKETSIVTSNAVVLVEETLPKDTEVQVGYFVKRIGGDYLEKRKILKKEHKKASETFFACLMSMITGGFLTLTGTKDNVRNECANISLVSALLLTIIVQMSYDNLSDWLEEDYIGSGTAFADSYIGTWLNEAQIIQIEDAVPVLHDVSLFFYAVGIYGYFSSTIASVAMLLCVGELSTDAGCAEWLERAGFFARAPYLFQVSASFFVYAKILRWVLGVKTLIGLFCVIFICITGYLTLVVVCFVYVRSCIKAHNRINEFKDLHLSEKDAEEDVKKWWKWNENAKTDGTLSDCLDALAGKHTKSALAISLDGISKERVAMYYYKLRAESIGIKVSESKLELELYQLCLQQLAALPARHHACEWSNTHGSWESKSTLVRREWGLLRVFLDSGEPFWGSFSCPEIFLVSR